MTDQQQTTQDVARLREMAEIREREAEYFTDGGQNEFADDADSFRRAADAIERLAVVEAERDEWKEKYKDVCGLVATMHKAATGAIQGPIRGVVEDVEDLREERDRLKAATRFCEKHPANGGTRSECLICVLESFNNTISAIDSAAIGHCAEGFSDYDFDLNGAGVVKRVEAIRDERDRMQEAVKVMRQGLQLIAGGWHSSGVHHAAAAFAAGKVEQADAILAGKEGEGK